MQVRKGILEGLDKTVQETLKTKNHIKRWKTLSKGKTRKDNKIQERGIQDVNRTPNYVNPKDTLY